METAATKLIEIIVNGDTRTVSAGLTVRDLLAEIGIAPDRVAIELNRKIVRQPDWSSVSVEPGAQMEIVQFVGGG